MSNIRLPAERVWRRCAFLVIGVLCSTVCLWAQAQVAAPFLGTWNASWTTGAKQYDAKFTVTESGGAWQTATIDRGNPCAGREIPMKVVSSTATEVHFTLQFSEVIAGCQNPRVELKLQPDGTVTGSRSKFELALKRQP